MIVINKDIRSFIAIFKDFSTKTDLKLSSFFLPALLSMSAALCEGIGIALLLPLVKGIFQQDFTFVREIQILKSTIFTFIPISVYQNTVIFIVLVSLTFSALTLSYTMHYFSAVAVSYQLRNFSDYLRRAIFSRYLKFGKLFFDRNNLGHLNNILISFTNQIAFELRTLQDGFNRLFGFIIYLFLMFMLSVRLTLLILLVMPVLNYSLRWLLRKIKDTSKLYVVSSKKINERIFNILSCIPLVKVYSQEKKEKEAFSSMSNDLRRIEFSIDKKTQLFQPAQEIMILIMVLFLVCIMSFMVVKEKTGQLSSFLVFFYIVRKASTTFTFLNILKNSFAMVYGPMLEVNNIFDGRDKFFIFGGEKEFHGLIKNIEFRHLNFYYIPTVAVLEDVNFTIEKGKVTALVGPSGAGKTTILNLILRFYECSSSGLFIDNEDIRNFTLASIRKHIALVSQDTLLFNDSIKNNIIYGLERDVTEVELTDIIKKARLYDYVKKLPTGLDTLIGDRGVKLSGGEKQRLAIARALLKNCEVLILDEATSSLDSASEKLIQEAINEAISGRTTVVVAHRLSTIKNADKVIVIEDGKISEEGSLDQLLEKKGRFYYYWQQQKFY